MTATSLDLTPSAVLARAADIIERNGLAKGNYYTADSGKPPAECPVCTYGAIAVAVGRDPDAWEDFAFDAAIRGAQKALLLLADHLDIAPWLDITWDDEDDQDVPTIDGWSDSTDPAVVVRELRAAAKAGA